MSFQLISNFDSKGDQEVAIKALVRGLKNDEKHQVLLGVTGSGKTFTMAKVIEKAQRPALIFSHNKTLAAQLYGEFKQFFPNNAVEYFISYYDYYQPEAYLPSTGTYIEKELSINEEIEKLRLSTTTSLLSGRRDIIVVASVSCIYGLADPNAFKQHVLTVKTGDRIAFIAFLHSLVNMLYGRTETEFKRGTFRVKGEIVDIFPAYADVAYRIYFWGDEIENIQMIDPETAKRIKDETTFSLFPARLFVASKEGIKEIIRQIQDDMVKQYNFFISQHKHEEAQRLVERTEYDLEMINELGYCSGIENYSRYFDRREIGQRPYCLLDYFSKDFILFIDESHATIPQIRGMSGGDKARKMNLVEHGFRLPSAMDNRPLTFDEFEQSGNQFIYVSATPTDYEFYKSEGTMVEQIIRPTGLLDPIISVRPSKNQIDDLMDEIDKTIENEHRILITTLTKRMAEELHKYLKNLSIKNQYIHSEIKSFERVSILRNLRLGVIDVLVGVNLLREGLDLPEVELVVIFDADKEGFLRNERSLIQTIGRAARNAKGRVIMYADKMTASMAQAIGETERRRKKQIEYNEKNNIIPKTIFKSKEAILQQTSIADKKKRKPEVQPKQSKKYELNLDLKNMSFIECQNVYNKLKKQMDAAAKKLNFIEAAQIRDLLFEIEKVLKK